MNVGQRRTVLEPIRAEMNAAVPAGDDDHDVRDVLREERTRESESVHGLRKRCVEPRRSDMGPKRGEVLVRDQC